MLDRRTSDFAQAVWTAAARVGNSAPKVTDEIMKALFPRTCEEARIEGADKMLRDGVVSAVTRILRGAWEPSGQRDFAEIDDKFQPLVSELRSRSYYVESAQEYVSVARLIEEPELLDDARKYMRRKGIECLDEAARLDALYERVTA